MTIGSKFRSIGGSLNGLVLAVALGAIASALAAAAPLFAVAALSLARDVGSNCNPACLLAGLGAFFAAMAGLWAAFMGPGWPRGDDLYGPNATDAARRAAHPERGDRWVGDVLVRGEHEPSHRWVGDVLVRADPERRPPQYVPEEFRTTDGVPDGLKSPDDLYRRWYIDVGNDADAIP